MTQHKTLIEAAVWLADVLTRENAALAAVDLAGAARIGAEKAEAVEIFAHARERNAALPQSQAALARDIGARLQDLAATNRRLLERAIVVQGRLIGSIARAAPRPSADFRYGANGGAARSVVAPMALHARA